MTAKVRYFQVIVYLKSKFGGKFAYELLIYHTRKHCTICRFTYLKIVFRQHVRKGALQIKQNTVASFSLVYKSRRRNKQKYSKVQSSALPIPLSSVSQVSMLDRYYQLTKIYNIQGFSKNHQWRVMWEYTCPDNISDDQCSPAVLELTCPLVIRNRHLVKFMCHKIIL